MLKEWRDKFISFSYDNEHWFTLALIIMALILIAIAVFGKPHHKALALFYVANPI